MNNTMIKLTKREQELLYLLVRGYSNTKIAKKMGISIHTVKAHIESIYRKFNVHNKVQAAIYSIYKGIIDINTL